MRSKKRFLIILGIIIGIFIVDFSLMLVFKTRPLFAIVGNLYKDGGTKEYYGIGYKAIKCKTLSGDNSIKIGFYNLEYSCNNNGVEANSDYYQKDDKTKIIFENNSSDESQIAVINVIYEDDKYRYIAGEQHSYVDYEGEKLTYKEALERDIITIDDLIRAEVIVFKEDKNISGINGECTFIRTFKVVDKLNYTGAVPEAKFVVLDQFQNFHPFILQLTPDQINILNKDKYYEFTFKGNKFNEDSLDSFKVVSIEETTKSGLEQIQESCN